eukprot:TRINITY_DN3970_c0_g1_i10.p1 TRINITY_DN3970_c0_g1~~TRINITY_DN3970_c0_g1_i10.p1  ORF type:complete len:378 (+),score=74.90 TRINITY_DN3970_c0_g1_i10:644-1777(+)
MRTRLLTAAILFLLLNSIAADGENDIQPAQNNTSNEVPPSEPQPSETPPPDPSTPDPKAPEVTPPENATPDTASPETAPAEPPETLPTGNPVPENPATQTPPTENPPPPTQDDGNKEAPGEVPEDITITPKAPENIKPRPDLEPLSTEQYERDAISYSHKGSGNTWNQSPEEEKAMIDFINAWAEHAAGMNSPIVNFEVPGGGVLEFYVNIAKTPQVLRGLYSVSESGAKSIAFTLTDPQNKIIFLRNNIRDLLFYPTVNLTGKYKIEFRNKNYFASEELTFAIAPGVTEAKGAEGQTHERKLDPSEKKMQAVEKNLNDLSRQQRFFDWRKTRQNEDVADIGWNSLYITIGESITVLALSIWEVYYIKKMLDFRQAV